MIKILRKVIKFIMGKIFRQGVEYGSVELKPSSIIFGDSLPAAGAKNTLYVVDNQLFIYKDDTFVNITSSGIPWKTL